MGQRIIEKPKPKGTETHALLFTDWATVRQKGEYNAFTVEHNGKSHSGNIGECCAFLLQFPEVETYQFIDANGKQREAFKRAGYKLDKKVHYKLIRPVVEPVQATEEMTEKPKRKPRAKKETNPIHE